MHIHLIERLSMGSKANGTKCPLSHCKQMYAKWRYRQIQVSTSLKEDCENSFFKLAREMKVAADLGNNENHSRLYTKSVAGELRSARRYVTDTQIISMADSEQLTFRPKPQYSSLAGTAIMTAAISKL